MNPHLVLVFVHITSVVVWVGGMFFAHCCLRPVVAATLEPAVRLPLMHAVLGRFFKWVLIAIVLIFASGMGMMLHIGFANAPRGWHWMMTSGILMMMIFGHIYSSSYRKLGRAVLAADWPAGGAAMNSIRRLVSLNLILGVMTIAFATLASAF